MLIYSVNLLRTEFHSVLQQGANVSLCLLTASHRNELFVIYQPAKGQQCRQETYNQHQTEKTDGGKENGGEKEMILNQPLCVSESLV